MGETCGRCERDGAAGAAGLCRACNELADADEAYKAAFRACQAATADYRARRIGDAEYLAARRLQDACLREWERLDYATRR